MRASSVYAIARVVGVAAGERVRRPIARTLADVPVRSSEITAQWLTAALCREHPDVHVETFVCTEAPGGTTSRWTIEVGYSADVDLPHSFFAKATTSLAQRLLLGLSEIIAGEPTFYTHFRPGLDIEAPVAHYSVADPRTWRSITLLETLENASFPGPTTRMTRAQMEDLLANLAIVHGAYWEHPDLHRHNLTTPDDFMRVYSDYSDFPARLKSGVARSASVLPPGLAGREPELYEGLRRALVRASDETPTLLHGDPHVGNTYVTASGSMGLGDWQIIHRGNWAFDVAYLMTTGLAVEDRRAWEHELIGSYLKRLSGAGGHPPSPDAAFDDYRAQSIYGYLAWLATIGRSAIQPKMQPTDVCLEIIQRTSHAVVDLDPLQALAL